ncbi:concanavalin A-like lectin/glucanase [Byssothecium circinans]|uniref:Concanavalin A-like lectin/glucanase n=1 Tax=Byssothecium circinans TaxID=147558 RepID=A0A6A5UBB8_9PLEO|nr:concanavalin A-like lectin/glucanase [Byssothecium circinans]
MKLSALISAVCWISATLAAFDYNRAGAVLKAPVGDSFETVTGSFIVPNLTGDHRLSIWVGIGDTTTQTYVLGGGVSYNKTLSTWSAFFPSRSIDTSPSVPAANGDNITVTVNIQTGTGGSVTIENKTKNKKTTQEVAAPITASPDALTALVADWWVQAYQVIPGELVQTPVFTTISITACSATTKNGVYVPLLGAGAYEIQGTSGQMWTKTTISGYTVAVTSQKVCQAPGC